MDFEGTLTNIRIAQVELDRLQFLVAIEKGKFQAAMDNLIRACEPVCAKAIATYNMMPICMLRILTEGMKISIDPKKKTISLVVRMRYLNGETPNETLIPGETGEIQRIRAHLQSHLEEGFREAGIPFTLDGFLVPRGYHEDWD